MSAFPWDKRESRRWHRRLACRIAVGSRRDMLTVWVAALRRVGGRGRFGDCGTPFVWFKQALIVRIIGDFSACGGHERCAEEVLTPWWET